MDYGLVLDVEPGWRRGGEQHGGLAADPGAGWQQRTPLQSAQVHKSRSLPACPPAGAFRVLRRGCRARTGLPQAGNCIWPAPGCSPARPLAATAISRPKLLLSPVLAARSRQGCDGIHSATTAAHPGAAPQQQERAQERPSCRRTVRAPRAHHALGGRIRRYQSRPRSSGSLACPWHSWDGRCCELRQAQAARPRE